MNSTRFILRSQRNTENFTKVVKREQKNRHLLYMLNYIDFSCTNELLVLRSSLIMYTIRRNLSVA